MFGWEKRKLLKLTQKKNIYKTIQKARKKHLKLKLVMMDQYMHQSKKMTFLEK